MIKSASEIRSAARTALSGHWAEAACLPSSITLSLGQSVQCLPASI